MKQSEKKRVRTDNKDRRPRGETGEGWPPEPDNVQSKPPKRLLKTRTLKSNTTAPQTPHTRANIIRGMNKTQHINNKSHEPDINKMKWKYAEIMRIGSTNIRAMRDPVKREETILQVDRHNVELMCLQEAKIPDSCCEVGKGFTFVFSSVSTIREHWGVGVCYRNFMENTGTTTNKSRAISCQWKPTCRETR